MMDEWSHMLVVGYLQTCPNVGSANGRSDACFQVDWKGTGETGKSHVTMGYYYCTDVMGVTITVDG